MVNAGGQWVIVVRDQWVVISGQKRYEGLRNYIGK